MSENISVVSVVGRFLEHSRIYTFEHGDEVEVYIGSADLMPRNLDNRVELLTPVKDPICRAEVLDTLERCLIDNVNAWKLQSDGTWTPVLAGPSDEPRSVQRELLALTASRAAEASIQAP